jgi:hypothetical protein
MRRCAIVLLLVATSAPQPALADDVMTTKVSFGGYVETYYSLNLRLPSNHINNLRGFDNRERTFTLSNVALDGSGERGPLKARLVLQVGTTPSTYFLAEPSLAGTAAVNATNGELWKYVQQATLAYAGPGELVVDAGLFPSPVGLEVIPVKDNWNWSRSNLFFGLPFYHTGLRAAYPLGHGWTGMLHAYNGWNSVVDNNVYPSIGLSVTYADEKTTAQFLYFGGIERPTGAPEGNAWRNLFDAYTTYAISDQTSIAFQFDAGVEPNNFGTSAWAAGALYGKVQLSSKLYAAARGDYFREWVAEKSGVSAAAIFWPTQWISSGTVTLAAQPIDGLSVRLEFRHDHAKTPAFFGGTVAGDGVTTPYVPNRRAQETLTLGATAWF